MFNFLSRKSNHFDDVLIFLYLFGKLNLLLSTNCKNLKKISHKLLIISLFISKQILFSQQLMEVKFQNFTSKSHKITSQHTVSPARLFVVCRFLSPTQMINDCTSWLSRNVTLECAEISFLRYTCSVEYTEAAWCLTPGHLQLRPICAVITQTSKLLILRSGTKCYL